MCVNYRGVSERVRGSWAVRCLQSTDCIFVHKWRGHCHHFLCIHFSFALRPCALSPSLLLPSDIYASGLRPLHTHCLIPANRITRHPPPRPSFSPTPPAGFAISHVSLPLFSLPNLFNFGWHQFRRIWWPIVITITIITLELLMFVINNPWNILTAVCPGS